MESFEALRPFMFSIAYRMLGSVMDAEDILQDAYLRYQAVAPDHIESPKAFLSTVVTRLCLDQLKSAQAQREQYIGPWLPEPLLTGEDPATVPPLQHVDQVESISIAFLVLLENLSPLERAVFLLREVFDYHYPEIAAILDKEEAACRQLFSRAKKHLAENRPRFESSPQNHAQILGKFLLAVEEGRLEGLMALLAEDVMSWSDGGGKTTAALRPIRGREKVARFFIGLAKKATPNTRVEIAEINGKPAVLIRLTDKVFSVMNFEVSHGEIREIRIILNPEKLSHLP